MRKRLLRALALIAALWVLACVPASAAVSFRSQSTGINATITGNSTDTEPSGCASGDALIGIISFASGSSTAANASAPSGWTLVGSATQGAMKTALAYIIRTGSAPSYTWTTAGASIYRDIQTICLTGAAALTLDSQSASGGTASAIHTVDSPSTTAVAATSMAVSAASDWGGGSLTITAPAGYVIRTTATAGTYNTAMATKSLASPGAEDPAAFGNLHGAATPFDYWDGMTLTFTDTGGGAVVPKRMMLLGVGGLV